MKSKQRIKVILVCISLLSCGIYSQPKKSIIGKWSSYKVEWRYGGDTTSSGEKINAFFDFEFTRKSLIHHLDGEAQKIYEYEYIGDTLFIDGGRRYIVESSNNQELILVEINRNGSIDKFNQRFYFKKVKSFSL